MSANDKNGTMSLSIRSDVNDICITNGFYQHIFRGWYALVHVSRFIWHSFQCSFHFRFLFCHFPINFVLIYSVCVLGCERASERAGESGRACVCALARARVCVWVSYWIVKVFSSRLMNNKGNDDDSQLLLWKISILTASIMPQEMRECVCMCLCEQWTANSEQRTANNEYRHRLLFFKWRKKKHLAVSFEMCLAVCVVNLICAKSAVRCELCV